MFLLELLDGLGVVGLVFLQLGLFLFGLRLEVGEFDGVVPLHLGAGRGMEGISREGRRW